MKVKYTPLTKEEALREMESLRSALLALSKAYGHAQDSRAAVEYRRIADAYEHCITLLTKGLAVYEEDE